MDYPISINDYDLGKKVGSGTFGSVYVAYVKKTDEKVAIKKFKSESTFDNEVHALQINCKDIIQILTYFSDKYTNYIVLEYMDGDLSNFRPLPMSENHLINLAKSITRATAYIHTHNLAHMDIKRGNILFKRNDLDVVFKICDLGFVCETEFRQCKGGTTKNLSPEIAQLFYDGYHHISTQKGQKCDVWTIGIVLFRAIGSSHLFNTTNIHSDTESKRDKLLKAVMSLTQDFIDKKINNKTINYSPVIDNIIKACLTIDPDKRPSIHQLMSFFDEEDNGRNSVTSSRYCVNNINNNMSNNNSRFCSINSSFLCGRKYLTNL